MKLIFLTALLIVQSQSGVAPVGSSTRFQLKTAGTFSFDISGPPRTVFETVGEKAGLTVIVDRDYRPAIPTVTLKLQDVDIVQALNSMSAAANTFWVPIGKQAIFITDNNATKHRDYDLARFKLMHLSGPKTTQELLNAMNALRQQANLTTLTAYPKSNLLLWKDTPEKSDTAEQRLAEVSRQMFGASATIDSIATYEKDASGNVFLMDGSGRNINPKISGIQPASPGSFSLDVNNQPTREAFTAIAAKAGLSILFNRDLRPVPSTLTLKLKDVDVYEALDILTMATGTFWTPLDRRTIFIVDSNTTMHRDYDLQIVDVVHLTGPQTAQELNDVLNMLRQTLNLTSMAANPATNSLLFRDTPDKVALAEQIAADLEAQLQGTKKIVSHVAAYETDTMGNVYVLDGSRRNMNPVLSQLAVTSAGPFSIDINQPSRTAIETIAAQAGLSVVYDRDFRPTPTTLNLKLNDTNIFSSLDMASTALRTFWVPLDRRTIFVTDNNSTKHRDFDPLVLEVIDLPGLQSEQELNELMNGVRQVLNAPVLYAVPRTNSLVLRDTPSRVALAKSVIGDLRISGGAIQAATPPVISVLYLETDSLSSFYNASNNAGLKSYAAPASAQLRPRTTDSFSLHMTEDARRAYEVLGETTGLNVTFDSRFAAGQPAAFHLENVTAIQALDQLGTQSHNFWQVIDSKTVYITPENVSSTRAYEPTVLKTFRLSNTPPADVNIIVNMARGMFNIQDVMTDAASNTIDVRTRPTIMILLEKLITALDRPVPAR